MTARSFTPSVVALLMLMSASQFVVAGAFSDAFQAAQQHDPSWRAAQHDLEAARHTLAIAQSGRWPTLTFSASDTKVEGSRTIEAPPAPTVSQALDYRAPSQSLQLRLPLYNRELGARIQVAERQYAQATALQQLRRLDLADRLGRAWIEAIQNQAQVNAAEAAMQLAGELLNLETQRLDKGEGTTQEVASARANLAVEQARRTEAALTGDVARLTLLQLTGRPVYPSRILNLACPDPCSLPHLADQLQAMREYHPALQVRRLAVQTAEASQMRARAGHHPQLDLVASSSNNTNESLSALNQSAQQRSVGLQLNVPLYQGGQVGHAVRQAIAETDRAAAELDAEELNQAREATRLHAAATAAQVRTNAQGQAVQAAQLGVRAAQRGMQTGLTTRLELIAAQRRLVQAETEMTQSQADHWLARYRLALRTSADPLSAIAELDRLEHSSPP